MRLVPQGYAELTDVTSVTRLVVALIPATPEYQDILKAQFFRSYDIIGFFLIQASALKTGISVVIVCLLGGHAVRRIRPAPNQTVVPVEWVSFLGSRLEGSFSHEEPWRQHHPSPASPSFCQHHQQHLIKRHHLHHALL